MDDLSFDPRIAWFDLPGTAVRWSVQVFTANNVYLVDPDATLIETAANRVTLEASGLALAGRQRRAAGRVRADVLLDGSRTVWQVEAEHAEPVKAVKLLLTGLPAAGLEAGWWSATSARGAPATRGRLLWTYPSQDWVTPWACAGAAATLSVRDPLVRHKRLHVHQPPYAPEPIAEVIHHERADARAGLLRAPEMVLTLCDSEAAVNASWGEHLRYVESTYDLTPWERRTDFPAWLEGIDLILSLHGQHWTGYVFNHYRAMAEALSFVCEHIEGERVLAYLPGWEGRYYHDYPEYRPGPDLGGPDGFLALVEAAHRLGVRVMPMFGAHGANVARYPDWERAVIRNDTDRYVSLLNSPDWDGDRAGEGDQVFLNPGEREFRAHLTGQLHAVVDGFGVDGVFLDTAAFWFDDPRHDQLEGYRLLLGELRRAHPDLLVAAEGWFDAILPLFPLAQQWLGVQRDGRYPELPGRYIRTTEHLALGAPGHGSTGVHEQGFRADRAATAPITGHIPSISIVDDTLREHADELVRRTRAAAERVA